MNFLSSLIWFIYYLLVQLVSLLVFWVPQYKKRNQFEKKNQWERLAQSFSIHNLKADYCFEFSSEGEYQQIASLVDDALAEGKLIELIYFSPSVEKTIKDLAARYPEQIRYLRYPIIRFGFGSWITSKNLIMVRYDLFPEFLFWSLRPGNTLKLLWMSFKRERVFKKSVSPFKKLFLKKAQLVVYASEADQKFGQSLGLKGPGYDFRIEQIKRRLNLREEKFKSHFPEYTKLKEVLKNYPREKRVIIGNAWPSDLFLLKQLPKDFLLVIVPHQLHPEMIDAFHKGIVELGREFFEMNSTGEFETSNTYLINKKGILCELYADFGKAYVGGGFETSIHSVLEPLVSGSDHLSVGPKNQRSTEFDIALSLEKIKEVKSLEEFTHWLLMPIEPIDNSLKLEPFMNGYASFKKEVLSC